MKKVLLLPLFKMPSGHHQVADAVSDILGKRSDQLEFKKVDLLSYSNLLLEKLVSNVYLKWIHHTPGSYDWAYKQFAYSKDHKQSSFKGLENYFIKKLDRLLQEEQPDLIVCTHGFPSLMLSRMKSRGKLLTPVINVYTDFFINDIWGRQGIDYHLVSTQSVKDRLIHDYQVTENKVIITGIPIHEVFRKPSSNNLIKQKVKRILVAGGSSGLGNIVGLLQNTNDVKGYEYIVLCGNNKQLYQEIQELKQPHITARSYISSREDMNQLYDEVDAIVTKPGGITVSEALMKRLPIFVHSALPGQEDVNLEYLKKQELVYVLDVSQGFERQLEDVLNDDLEMHKLQRNIAAYFKSLEITSPALLNEFLTGKFLSENTRKAVVSYPKSPSGIVNKIKKYAKKITINENL